MAEHAERIAGVVAAGRAAGVPIVVNARVDVALRRAPGWRGRDDRARPGLPGGRRGLRLPIALCDESALTAVVEAAGTVNALLWPGGPLERLRALGVVRVSLGNGLHREMGAALARRLADLRAQSPPAGEVRGPRLIGSRSSSRLRAQSPPAGEVRGARWTGPPRKLS